MPTQEQIDKQRAEVEELRQKVRESRSSNADTTAERTREVQAARLSQEKAQLQAQLGLTEEARKERNTKKVEENKKAVAGTLTPVAPSSDSSTSTERPTTPTPSAPKGTTDDKKE